MKVLTKEQQRAVSGGYKTMGFATYQGDAFVGHLGNFYTYMGYHPEWNELCPYYYETFDV